MIAGERVGLPHGWAVESRAGGEGPPVHVAVCTYRVLGATELRFESTSWGDLLDQVLEAMDAWQTELELAQAAGPRVVFGVERAV